MVTLMAMCQSLLNLAISHQAHHHIPQFLASDKIGLMRSDNDELIRNIGCFFFLSNTLKHMYLGQIVDSHVILNASLVNILCTPNL